MRKKKKNYQFGIYFGRLQKPLIGFVAIVVATVLITTTIVRADSLQQQINQLNSQNSQVQSTINGLQGQDQTYQQAVDTLQAQINDIQNSINNSENEQAQIDQ